MTKEFGNRFSKLPERLKRQWWDWTHCGKHSPTNELMWTIEAFDEDLAVYLSNLSFTGAEATNDKTNQETAKDDTPPVNEDQISRQVNMLFGAKREGREFDAAVHVHKCVELLKRYARETRSQQIKVTDETPP